MILNILIWDTIFVPALLLPRQSFFTPSLLSRRYLVTSTFYPLVAHSSLPLYSLFTPLSLPFHSLFTVLSLPCYSVFAFSTCCCLPLYSLLLHTIATTSLLLFHSLFSPSSLPPHTFINPSLLPLHSLVALHSLVSLSLFLHSFFTLINPCYFLPAHHSLFTPSSLFFSSLVRFSSIPVWWAYRVDQ